MAPQWLPIPAHITAPSWYSLLTAAVLECVHIRIGLNTHAATFLHNEAV